MKLRSFIYGLTATVLVLLLVGAGGLYWIVSHSPLDLLQGGRQSTPNAAMFVPKQAPFMASLLVNPDRLTTVQQVLTRPGYRRRTAAEIKQLRQSLLAGTKLDYVEDVQPWLGEEITLAITTPDLDRDALNGQQPGYFLALESRDPERSREFLQVFWQRQAVGGADLIFEQYAGVKLIYKAEQPSLQPSARRNSENTSASNPQGVASALVGDRFLLFANHPKVLREAINNVQAPGLNLESNTVYQEALKQLPGQRIGVTFVNLPQLSAWLGDAFQTAASTAASPSAIAAPGVGSNPLFESLVVAFKLERKGLLAETALLTAAGETLQPTRPRLNGPVNALHYLPDNTVLAASGAELGAVWSQLLTGLRGYDAIAALIKQPVATLESRWEIDLPETIFSWVEGEYALGLLQRSDASAPDWVFVAERPDLTEAEAQLEQLDSLASRQGLTIGQVDLVGHSVSAWTRLSTLTGSRAKASPQLQADIAGVHTTIDRYEIFASSLNAMAAALQASQKPLNGNPAFQQAIAPLDTRNDGYLYIDWPHLRGWTEQQLPLVQFVELAAQPLFNHLQSLTLSSYGSDRELRRGGVFIRFAS